jgi:hypothetical protein
MTHRARRLGVLVLCLAVALTALSVTPATAAPEVTMSWAAHLTLAPRWLDPGETESAITPFMVLYSLHDAMVIQKLLHDRVIYAPIWENGFIRGVGPRAEEAALTLIPAFPYSAPSEELRLKRQ